MKILNLKGWKFEISYDDLYLDALIEVTTTCQLYTYDIDSDKYEFSEIEDVRWEIGFYTRYNKDKNTLEVEDIHDVKVINNN